MAALFYFDNNAQHLQKMNNLRPKSSTSMKNSILTMSLLVVSSLTSLAQTDTTDYVSTEVPAKKWKIGATAGFGRSKTTIADLPQPLKWRESWQLGATIQYQFDNPKTYAQADILLNKRGYNIQYNTADIKIGDTISTNIKGFQNIYYLDIPAMVGYKFTRNISGYLGLCGSLRAFSVFDYSGQTTLTTPDTTYITKIKERDYSNDAIDLIDLSFCAGLSCKVNKKVNLYGRFSRDLIGISIGEVNGFTNKHANMWFNFGAEFYFAQFTKWPKR